MFWVKWNGCDVFITFTSFYVWITILFSMAEKLFQEFMLLAAKWFNLALEIMIVEALILVELCLEVHW